MTGSSFGERLRHARLALGQTQEQIGFAVDVSKASVSAWENGRESPSFRALSKLGRAVGQSLDELVCGAESLQGPAPKLPADERVLLRWYRHLPEHRRRALLELIGGVQSLPAGSQSADPVEDPPEE